MNPNKMFYEAPRYNIQEYDPTLYGYGCYQEEMRPTIEEGDIVIFPSQIEHGVQMQPKNDELYVSFSFNVELSK
jgi:quercetin dioxygenase-like cupin family protein